MWRSSPRRLGRMGHGFVSYFITRPRRSCSIRDRIGEMSDNGSICEPGGFVRLSPIPCCLVLVTGSKDVHELRGSGNPQIAVCKNREADRPWWEGGS